jgi:ribosomal protein S18 acetylase RimI-like enzyme
MIGNITLRDIQETDARNDNLHRLIGKAANGFPDMVWGSGGRGSRDRTAVVAEIDGETVGMLMGRRQPDTMYQPRTFPSNRNEGGLDELEALAPATWFIDGLTVLRASEGQGVDEILMAKAEDRARETNAAGLSTIVPFGDTGLADFYRAKGFTVRDQRNGYYSLGDPVTWFLMVKDMRRG